MRLFWIRILKHVQAFKVSDHRVLLKDTQLIWSLLLRYQNVTVAEVMS